MILMTNGFKYNRAGQKNVSKIIVAEDDNGTEYRCTVIGRYRGNEAQEGEIRDGKHAIYGR